MPYGQTSTSGAFQSLPNLRRDAKKNQIGSGTGEKGKWGSFYFTFKFLLHNIIWNIPNKLVSEVLIEIINVVNSNGLVSHLMIKYCFIAWDQLLLVVFSSDSLCWDQIYATVQ